MKPKITDLERVAKSATQGEWADDNLPEAITMYRKLGHTSVAPKTTDDGIFIATFNPQAALALIEALKTAREYIIKELDGLDGCCACGAEEQDGEGYKGVTCYLHEALAALDEQFDWTEEQCNKMTAAKTPSEHL